MLLEDRRTRERGRASAAERLGLNPRTLRHRLKKLGIEVPSQPGERVFWNAQPLKDKEREHILSVLEESGWKVAGQGNAAERLGLNPSTLRFRMKRLGIQRGS
jgi:transcriptional regulator with GAF, ATPase, and Fis domain